jgi:pimeloyl-ACP methyl ester carboxylesterase
MIRTTTGACTIDEHEVEEVERANTSGRTPVVFVHGLWLLASSWDRWATVFEEAGYSALSPGWPDDPETVEEAKAHPDVFAGKSIGDVADRIEGVIRRLDKKPAVIGHSVGGLLAQIIAGRGLQRSRWRSIRHRSAASSRSQSPRFGLPHLCSPTRRTETAPFPSPLSSSGTASRTR